MIDIDNLSEEEAEDLVDLLECLEACEEMLEHPEEVKDWEEIKSDSPI